MIATATLIKIEKLMQQTGVKRNTGRIPGVMILVNRQQQALTEARTDMVA